MSGDVRDRGPAQQCGCVVPTVRPARGMVARVVAVAVERRQVDTADEGEIAVDDHELLVVAVHRPLVRVEPVADACAAGEPFECVAHVSAVWPEER